MRNKRLSEDAEGDDNESPSILSTSMIFKGGRHHPLFFRLFLRSPSGSSPLLKMSFFAKYAGRASIARNYTERTTAVHVFRPLIIRDSTELEKPFATTVSCKRSLELLVASLHPTRRSICTIAFPHLKDPIAFPTRV